MDLERMTREMERMTSASRKSPLITRLLDAERLTEAERNTLRGDAERRMQEGLAVIARATSDLAVARRSGDTEATARAIERLAEGTALWETGSAVQRALTAPAPAASDAALRWFRGQMNLGVPSIPLPGLRGLSWPHAAAMAALVLFAAGAVTLYFHKVRRSLRLLNRLTRTEHQP